MTKKEKLETFDSVLAERDLLRLAIFDLTCKTTKFPFGRAVSVDIGTEIDGDYAGVYRISKSNRAMPYYMVVAGGGTQFWTENDIEDHQTDTSAYWRAVRLGTWKIKQAEKK